MSEWEKAGIVGVDSGQLMVVDPTYIDSEWVKEDYRLPHPRWVLNEAGLDRFPHAASWEWGFDFKDMATTYATPWPEFGDLSVNELREQGLIRQLEPVIPEHAPFGYNAACLATTNAPHYGQLNYRMGHPGVAVVFSSGWGDGVYEVQIRKVDGRIAEARIIMIDDDEEYPFS